MTMLTDNRCIVHNIPVSLSISRWDEFPIFRSCGQAQVSGNQNKQSKIKYYRWKRTVAVLSRTSAIPEWASPPPSAAREPLSVSLIFWEIGRCIFLAPWTFIALLFDSLPSSFHSRNCALLWQLQFVFAIVCPALRAPGGADDFLYAILCEFTFSFVWASSTLCIRSRTIRELN